MSHIVYKKCNAFDDTIFFQREFNLSFVRQEGTDDLSPETEQIWEWVTSLKGLASLWLAST